MTNREGLDGKENGAEDEISRQHRINGEGCDVEWHLSFGPVTQRENELTNQASESVITSSTKHETSPPAKSGSRGRTISQPSCPNESVSDNNCQPVFCHGARMFAYDGLRSEYIDRGALLRQQLDDDAEREPQVG